MKYYPQRYREQSSAFFGKRGMSWHGAALVFHPDTVLPWPLDIRTLAGVDRRMLYLHDVLENDIQQDQYTSLSILESVLNFVK